MKIGYKKEDSTKTIKTLNKKATCSTLFYSIALQVLNRAPFTQFPELPDCMYLLSNQKVPKGIKEATKAIKVFPKLHFSFIQTSSKKIPNKTKSSPCNQPKYLTNRGWSAKYFIGMAKPNKTR